MTRKRVWAMVPAVAALIAVVGGPVRAANLQAIEDRQQIEQVWARYAQALDTADPEAYGSLFTKDAYLEVDGKAYKGQEQIRGLIGAIRAKLAIDKLPADEHGKKFGPIRHILSGLIVDIEGNKATSESYWTEIISNGKNAQGVGNFPSVLKMGRYADELVKHDGKWLYSKRIITGDLQMARPAGYGDPPPKN